MLSPTLTNRERARLQTFPDDYLFKGSKESVRRQIGMAVSAKGADIFETVRTFAGIEYENVPCNVNRGSRFVKLLVGNKTKAKIKFCS